MKRLTFTAAALLFAASVTSSAFAEEDVDHELTTDLGGVTVDFNGIVVYSDVFSVLLPTDDALSFTLDPQGVYADDNDLDEYAGGGRIIPDYGDLKVINFSSTDIALTIAMSATTNSTDTRFIPLTGGGVSSSIAAVSGDAGNNVFIYATPSSVNVQDRDQDFEPSSSGFVMGTTPSDVKFLLGAKTSDDEGNGTAIQLGGYVNPNADWTNWTAQGVTPPQNTVGARLVFSFAKATGDEVASALADDIPGLIKAGASDYANAARVSAGFTAQEVSVSVSAANFALPFVTAGKSLANAELRSGPSLSTLPTLIPLEIGHRYTVENGVVKLNVSGFYTTGTRYINLKLADGPDEGYTLKIIFEQ